jgi:hypothetical protein
MLSFCNSTGIPSPVTDGIRADLIGDRLVNLFTIVTPMTDGIREYQKTRPILATAVRTIAKEGAHLLTEQMVVKAVLR